MTPTNDAPVTVDDLTRPIIGIENRTAQEAFDIMADRIRSRLAALASAPAGDWVQIDGNEIWEALFGILKGDVPDALNEDVCDQLAAAFARPHSPAGGHCSDTDFAWIVPRHPTDAMVQAGLYHCTADMGFADLFTAFHAMVDEAQQDDALLASPRAAVGEREAADRLKAAVDDAEAIDSTGVMVKCADLRAILAAALARPRAAVGERTAILAAVLRYDHDRANIMGVGSGSFHKVRNDFVDAILALQSAPAKVEE